MSPSATPIDVASTMAYRTHGQKELDASRLKISLVPDEEQRPVPNLRDPARSTFNTTTAHMLQAPWNVKTGWGTPRLEKYAKIALEPTASVLHYATESFEGLKAYRGFDGKLRLFRPLLNCERMVQSNSRVSLPPFDPEQLLSLISSFLAVECPRWLPDLGSSFYVRPAMIGSGSAMGLTEPPEALFFLFAALTPQPTDVAHPGLKLLATSPKDQVRAWPGGFGSAKVGASYGPSQKAQARAKERGYDQVLWLFGEEKLVTEAGGSNFFVVWKSKESSKLELITAPLNLDLVLPGITRRSVLELARERLPELQVVERAFTVDEIVEANAEGRLVEAFVSGTAMFIQPVGMIQYEDEGITFPTTTSADGFAVPKAKYSSTIKSWLKMIMDGAEKHAWAHEIEETRPVISRGEH